jgi:dTDP-4-dehydrorhamnose reductase
MTDWSKSGRGWRQQPERPRWQAGIAMADRKLLILGASGLIGSTLIQAWHPRPLVATYLTRPIPGGVFFDLSRERLKDRILRPGHGFTHAVLAQGISKLETCARLRATTTAINVTGSLQAIDDLLEAGVHPIFLSSDAVFDGSSGLRTEAEEPRPLLSYGHDKYAVETYLSVQAAPSTILRPTKVIAGFPDYRNPLSQWLTDIETGRTIRCAMDQILTPVDVDYVTQAILFFIATGIEGVFHISGSEMITRYALVQRLLAQMPPPLRRGAIVRPCPLDEFATFGKLPLNCALSNAKFVALSGMTPRSIDQICDELCTRVFSQPDCLRGEIPGVGNVSSEAGPFAD